MKLMFGMNSVMPTMMLVALIPFCLVFGLMVFVIVMKFRQIRKDDKSPRLSVDAVVVAKRMEVSGYGHSRNSSFHTTSTRTSYFATFQVNSGDRMELHLGPYDYGMLAEGDSGILEFQGSRFLSFSRK